MNFCGLCCIFHDILFSSRVWVARSPVGHRFSNELVSRRTGPCSPGGAGSAFLPAFGGDFFSSLWRCAGPLWARRRVAYSTRGDTKYRGGMASYLRSLGGEIVSGQRIENLAQLPKARAVLLDIGTRQLVRLAGDKLPASYRRKLEKFRYDPGVFKIDYALDAPIPWAGEKCRHAGTVHVGGPLEEVAFAERTVAQGELPERPFVLMAQPTLFDPTRAPEGKHIAWAYCHVPAGSNFDMTERIENQIERFAPGFRDRILARHSANCSELELTNPNLVNGTINGGANNLSQLLARPILSAIPYRVPIPGVYLCSASTPPGGGVHGMCGFHAAEAALRDRFGESDVSRGGLSHRRNNTTEFSLQGGVGERSGCCQVGRSHAQRRGTQKFSELWGVEPAQAQRYRDKYRECETHKRKNSYHLANG